MHVVLRIPDYSLHASRGKIGRLDIYISDIPMVNATSSSEIMFKKRISTLETLLEGVICWFG